MAEPRGKSDSMVAEDSIDPVPPYTDSATPYYEGDIAKRDAHQNRLSPYSFANLPEVVPAGIYEDKQVAGTVFFQGKEVISEDQKEVIHANEEKEIALEQFPQVHDAKGGKELASATSDYTSEQHFRQSKNRLDRRFCGIRARWALLWLVLLSILIVSLGAGLGAGLARHNSNEQRTFPSGALNGTKLSLVTQSFTTENGSTQENLVMYFQHHSGHIRWMWLADNGTWVGGDETYEVATNAKNNTPISAVSYIWNGASFWRVYYVDNNNILRDVWAGNNTQGWALGPLSSMPLSVLNDNQVGMVACWFGPKADTEFAKGFPVTKHASELTIRVVYADTETSFQELNYNGVDQIYVHQQSISNVSGHATPACYNSGNGTVDYLMLLNQDGAVNVYWKDSNTDLANTTNHPINVWTNSSISISNIESSASLNYLDYLYAEDATDMMIKGYGINFAAENTTLSSNSPFVIPGKPGLRNTGLAVTVLPFAANSSDVCIFYQTNGSSISEYRTGSSVVITVPFS